MKKYLILTLLLLLTLSGCQQNNMYALSPLGLNLSQNPSPAEDETNFSSGHKQNNIDFNWFREIAQVFADNKNGELLGLYYDETTIKKSTYQFKIYPALYLMKQVSKKLSENYSRVVVSGIKVADPEAGYQILDADFNDSWYVWIETNKKNWNIYSLNRQTNEKALLAEGVVLGKSQLDLPGISLDQDKLVYNDNRSNVAKIISVDLRASQAEEIFSQGNGAILGKPIMYKNYIVWSQKDKPDDMNQIVLFNMSNKQTKKISSSSNNSIYPYIWNSYVAWLSYPNKIINGNRNLVLFNIREDKVEFETLIDKGIVLYQPTISNGTVIWPKVTTNQTSPINFSSYELYRYSVLNKKKEPFYDISNNVFLPSFENVKTLNSWVVWRPMNIDIPPNPEKTSQFIGTYLLPWQR